MTSGMPISTTAPAVWTPNVAVIGAQPAHGQETEPEDDADLAVAFRVAGDALVEYWRSQQADDSLIVVALYNYRHALELGLKAVLAELIASMRFELAPGQQAPLDLETLRGRVTGTHNLGWLRTRLETVAQFFRFPIHAEVAAVCATISSLDPDGQTLRYAMVKKGGALVPARPAPVYIDVPEFARQVGDACTALDGLLEHVRDVQAYQLSLGPEYEQLSQRRLGREAALRERCVTARELREWMWSRLRGTVDDVWHNSKNGRRCSWACPPWRHRMRAVSAGGPTASVSRPLRPLELHRHRVSRAIRSRGPRRSRSRAGMGEPGSRLLAASRRSAPPPAPAYTAGSAPRQLQVEAEI